MTDEATGGGSASFVGAHSTSRFAKAFLSEPDCQQSERLGAAGRQRATGARGGDADEELTPTGTTSESRTTLWDMTALVGTDSGPACWPSWRGVDSPALEMLHSLLEGPNTERRASSWLMNGKRPNPPASRCVEPSRLDDTGLSRGVPSSTRMTPFDSAPPLGDPTPNLSPKASVLLEAARRILLRDGLSHVTYEKVAKESGETLSLIRYYFGDKAGLLRALIQSELYLDCRKYLELVRSHASGVERFRAVLRQIDTEASDSQGHQAFMDVLAAVLRNEDLRPLFKSYSDWYVKLNEFVVAPIVGDQCEDLEGIATLTFAIAEGLQLRRQAGAHVDVEGALRLWERMLQDCLAKRRLKNDSADSA